MEQQQTGVFFDIARDAIAGDKRSEDHILKLFNDRDVIPFETRFNLKLRWQRFGWTNEDFFMGIARELTKVKQQRDESAKQLEPLHIEF